MIFTSKMFDKFLESIQLQASCLSKLSSSYVRESWNGADSKDLITAIKKSLAIIQKCEGKIVVTSLGRFGKVGEILSSTLTSIGTESIFLHSSEALNGDLSSVQERDILLVLHTTGNNSDVVEVAKICHTKGIPVISICDAAQSALGDVSNVVLELGAYPSMVTQDLVPTTSLVLMMAIGNSLASSICYMHSVTEKDLEELHPTSVFGTKEIIKVKDVMVEVETVPTFTKFEDLVAIMSASCRETVFISNTESEIVGVVTNKDISKTIDNSESKATLFTKVSAADIMNVDVRTVNEDDSCSDTQETMKLYKSTSILVDTKRSGVFVVDLHSL